MTFTPEAADRLARRVLIKPETPDEEALAEAVLALLAERDGRSAPAPAPARPAPASSSGTTYSFTSVGPNQWGVQVPTGCPASPGMTVTVTKKDGSTSTVVLLDRVRTTQFGEAWSINRNAKVANAPAPAPPLTPAVSRRRDSGRREVEMPLVMAPDDDVGF